MSYYENFSTELLIEDLKNDLSESQRPKPTKFQKIIRSIKKPILYLDKKFPGGTEKDSLFTLTIATIGIGVLFLPNTFRKSGLIGGIIQLFICWILTYYSLMTVTRCAIITKVSSYQELAHILFGRWARVIIDFAFLFGSGGTALINFDLMFVLFLNFLQSFSSNEAPISLEEEIDVKTTALFYGIALLFVIPLCLPKDLKNLRILWFLCFCFIIFLAITVVVQAVICFPLKQEISSVWNRQIEAIEGSFWENFPFTFSVFVFSFTCHNVLDIKEELNYSTEKSMQKVIFRTTFCTFLIYVLIGSFGYIAFAGTDLEALEMDDKNALLQYYFTTYSSGRYSIPVIMCMLFMCILTIARAPIYVNPARDAFKDIVYPIKRDRFGDRIESKLPTVAHLLLTFAIVLCGVCFSILLKKLDYGKNIISILGSSFYMLICFIFPATFFIRLVHAEYPKIHKIFAWIMLITMSALMFWNLYHNIKNDEEPVHVECPAPQKSL